MALNPRLTDWAGQVVWLVGASSGIGRALAARLHTLGAVVAVSARAAPALQGFCDEHPDALALPLDVTDAAALRSAASQLVAAHGRLDLVLFCAGTYRAMRATDFDLAVALQHQQVNYVGALNLLDAVLPVLLKQGTGHLSLVSSVAGFRGLPQSLAYGPTKAALTNLAETLYLDLQPLGIGVSVIHPGFVETPLTAQNEFTMPALMTPDEAAAAMLQGWRRGDFEVHFPKRFTLWLKALRLLGDRAYFAAVRRGTGL
ncbi:MAG: SDR family NAD(P)-dependent oxidoreductase [Rubrivivax sp.]|nr:SDR family NAD(P)-dependent oxidoreductase [Rubrivivax sp.]